MGEKRSKTEKLVLALSKNEAVEFQLIIRSNARSTLALLFDELRAGSKKRLTSDEEKERLFKLVFKKEYSKKEDFLLRNEQRLLTKELMRFLAGKQAMQELKSNPEVESYNYLVALKERGEFELFISEWPRVLELARRNQNHQIGHLTLRSVIDHLAETSRATIPDFDGIQAQIDNAIIELNSGYLIQYLHLKMKESFVQRTMQALGVELTLPDLTIDPIEIDDPNISNGLSKFYLEMCRSFRQSGQTKIHTLIRSIKLLKDVPTKALDHKSTLASLNAGIALEHFLSGDLLSSLQFHQQALENVSVLSDDRRVSYLFNYVSTLLRMERYNESIDLIRQHQNVWTKKPRLTHRFHCLLAMCLIFENKINEAEKLIPEDRKEGGIDHYYYFRIIQTITFFLREKPELALNELDNLEHTVRYNDSDRDTLTLIQGFRKLFNLVCSAESLSKTQVESGIDQLCEITDKASSAAKANHWLLYHWMNQQTARLSA